MGVPESGDGMTEGGEMNELQVPWLRSGTGKRPTDGGCILQVVDWISTGGWTGRPKCVHPVLRVLAIRANDSLPDAGRQKLLDLTPRLMGTAPGDPALAVKLLRPARDLSLPIYESAYPGDARPRKAWEVAFAWAECPCEAHAAAARATRAYAADNAASYQLLLDTLDEYDRLTGRTEVTPVAAQTYAAVCEVMA
jgi:hypothetical protein